ncbi:hypothetical protein [Azospirillum sp. sgz302134]
MAKPQPRPDFDPPLSPEEEAKYAALKADIEVAYQELLAGNVIDGEEVFAELYALYGKPPED